MVSRREILKFGGLLNLSFSGNWFQHYKVINNNTGKYLKKGPLESFNKVP